MNDFRVTADSNKIVFFRVGTIRDDKDWSPVLSLMITVCGKETLQASPV